MEVDHGSREIPVKFWKQKLLFTFVGVHWIVGKFSCEFKILYTVYLQSAFTGASNNNNNNKL